MRRFVMLLSAGCLAMLSDLAPGGCVARADVAGPTYIHRLHRVGYEILPAPGLSAWLERNAVELCVAFGVLVVGLMILWFCKHGKHVHVPEFFSWIINNEYVCLAVAVVGIGVFFAYQFCAKIAADFKVMAGGGEVYVDEPGWKYSTELTETEREVFNARIVALPSKLREQIEAEWKKDSSNGSEEHAKEVVAVVLNADHELLLACMALPLELIVDWYFVTEQWYNQGRHSFTHPRTVPWSQSEYEAKTVQRATKEPSLTSGEENRR